MSTTSDREQRAIFDVNRLPLLEVAVFTDRADVTRKLEFAVDEPVKGQILVVVERMSAMLDENSVRLVGGDSAKIIEVTIKKRSEIEDPVRRAKYDELRSMLKELSSKEKEINGEIQRVKEQRGIFMKAIQFQANQQPLDSVPKFLARPIEMLRKMDENVDQLQTRVTMMQKEIGDIRSDVDRLESGGSRWSVMILLDVLSPGPIGLTLTITVYMVSWAPTYAFRVDSSKRTMDVIYGANVRQNTGETWTRTEMRLISTHYGVEYGQVQALGNWKAVLVDEKKDLMAASGTTTLIPASTGPGASTGSQTATAATSSAAGAEASVDVILDSDENCVNYVFTSFADSIPSDGDEGLVVLITKRIPIDLFHECVPRRGQFAIAKARAINSVGAPMLPGRVAAYLDNSLVASSILPKVINLRERFEFSLGIDPAIQVEYKETATTLGTGSMGFFGKAVSTTNVEQKTVVKNKRRVAVTMRLVDMVPKSGDDYIKVTLTEPSAELLNKETAMVRHNPEEGCVMWDVFVRPGQDGQVVAKYTITYPTGKAFKLTDK